MTSVLNVDEIAAKDGTSPVTLTKQSAAKAWAFTTADGTTINGSFNVSTLTDTGTGIQTITYTNAMADAVYSGTMSAESNSDAHTQWMENIATTGIQARHYNGSSYQDIPTMWQIIGDLA